MQIGDVVVRKSYGKDITFRIIDVKDTDNGPVYIIKGLNIRILADASVEDLELVPEERPSNMEQVFNKKVNTSIKKILMSRVQTKGGGYRGEYKGEERFPKGLTKGVISTKELSFGRPGRILHVDSDGEYLQNCLKVYRRLSLDVVGKVLSEIEQPKYILQLVQEHKPDIVVLTGHDAMEKNTSDYMDINSYRNSKYFIESVSILRNYEPNYDDLVIFAGACQSFYEGILDAGANFASSPERILIHCLDPVFLCEKIAYTNIEKVISIKDGLENTVTGSKGIGGLQTRGKYREGYPKSAYI